jgi:hypothetical protein
MKARQKSVPLSKSEARFPGSFRFAKVPAMSRKFAQHHPEIHVS